MPFINNGCRYCRTWFNLSVGDIFSVTVALCIYYKLVDEKMAGSNLVNSVNSSRLGFRMWCVSELNSKG